MTAAAPIFTIFTLRGLIRRQAYARRVAFGAGLVLSLYFGVLAVVAAISVGMVKAPGRLVYLLVVLGILILPFVTVTWSLSRPSAKAWFTSPPRSSS